MPRKEIMTRTCSFGLVGVGFVCFVYKFSLDLQSYKQKRQVSNENIEAKNGNRLLLWYMSDFLCLFWPGSVRCYQFCISWVYKIRVNSFAQIKLYTLLHVLHLFLCHGFSQCFIINECTNVLGSRREGKDTVFPLS